MSTPQTVFASYRTPITFTRINDDHPVPRQCFPEGSWTAALADLRPSRDVLWASLVASEADTAVHHANGESSFTAVAEGRQYRLRLVAPSPSEYRKTRRFGDDVLWPIQHHQVSPEAAPELASVANHAYDGGYRAVNEQMAAAVLQETLGRPRRATRVMVADNYLLLTPGLLRKAWPDLVLQYVFHTPWTQPDTWRVLPRRVRTTLFESVLACDIVGFLSRRWARNFMLCCEELLGRHVDLAGGSVEAPDGRPTWVRTYPMGIAYETFDALAISPATRRYEEELLRSRPPILVLVVARPERAKHIHVVLAAFDLLLAQHPELRRRVVLIGDLIDRQDLPMRRYPEYIETLRSMAAEVNSRHGADDWTPVKLRVRHNLEETVAAYKQYDVLLATSCMDGMNRVAKEGAAVNERNGVLVVSENAGLLEDVNDSVLVVNPFDVYEQADAIYRAITMPDSERRIRAARLREITRSSTPTDWIAAQLRDLDAVRGTPSLLP